MGPGGYAQHFYGEAPPREVQAPYLLCTIIGVERVLLLHILSTEKWNRKLKKPVCIGSETQGGKNTFPQTKRILEIKKS